MIASYYAQILKLLSRPAHILPNVRGRWLFLFTHILLYFPIFKSLQIKLGKNVRLQKLSSLMAEASQARIEIADHCIIYEDAKIEAYGSGFISIGESSIIGRTNIFCRQQIEIGAFVVTSWDVFIQDYDPHPVDSNLRRVQTELMIKRFQPQFGNSNQDAHQDQIENLEKQLQAWSPPQDKIVIGNNVWLGANTTILKGARIGDGCIVAAHSVVLKGDYPAGSLICGVPAKVLKALS